MKHHEPILVSEINELVILAQILSVDVAKEYLANDVARKDKFDVWVEFRHAMAPHFEDPSKQNLSMFVRVVRVKKTGKTRDKVLFAGTGNNSVATLKDLLVQVRKQHVLPGSLINGANVYPVDLFRKSSPVGSG